jgi:hypothetical protein
MNMRIITNDVLELEVILSRYEFDTKCITVHVELDEECYDNDDNYKWDFILWKLWNELNGSHYYDEMEVSYQKILSKNIFSETYVFNSFGIKDYSYDIKPIK